jgi:hypothetical protein
MNSDNPDNRPTSSDTARSTFPGNLRTRLSFSVRCGMCRQTSVEAIDGVTTKTAAAQRLRGLRWAYTRAWHWICPTCDRFGSAGVVPPPPAGKEPA